MTGYYKMVRGWMKNPVFKNDPLTEREAWEWIIGEASYADREWRLGWRVLDLQRGQLCHSYRYMAEAWHWKKDRVARYLKLLQRAEMIDVENATGSATAERIISVRNYAIYQGSTDDDATDNETPPKPIGRIKRDSNATATRQQRDKTEEGKEGKSSYTVEFETFWAAYPGRSPHPNPTKPAAKAFNLVVKHTAPKLLIEGARRYAAHIAATGTDPKFIAQAVTWLNQARWEEQHEVRPPVNQPLRSVI